MLSGCICVFLNWDEQRKDLVEHLRMLGIPVLVLVIVEPGSANRFEKSARDGTFMVLEKGKIEEGLGKL